MLVGEFFTHGPPWIDQLQNRFGAFDKNVTLVLANCASYPLDESHIVLMQPFSLHPVESLSDSASLRRKGPSSSSSPNSESALGKGPRCFQKLILLGLRGAAWPHTFGTAQGILNHYRTQGLIQEAKLFRSGPKVLKLLFESRSHNDKV